MERKLSFTDVTKTVEDAYEKYKSIKEGTVDARVAGESREDAFGISVVLTDGRVFTKGDTEQQVSLVLWPKCPFLLSFCRRIPPMRWPKKAHAAGELANAVARNSRVCLSASTDCAQ